MLELIFPAPVSLERFRESPLAPHLEAYATTVAAVGYTYSSIRPQLYLLNDLGCWLARRNLAAAALNEAVIDAFIATRRRRKGRSDRATLRRFLDQLREGGVASPRVICDDNVPFGKLMRSYTSFLTKERGLTSAAVSSYTTFILRFLSERCPQESPRLDAVRASDVIAFVVQHAHSMSRKRSQLMSSALRSFCRFLLQKGLIAIDLAAAVPAVADWRQATVPKFLSAAEIERLLCACKAERCQRDYAILLILARLGLRACEVVKMELGDIDWRAGEIIIRGKGRAFEKLPLPVDVGRALSAYIRNERPSTPTRRVFIRVRAPHFGFANSIAVCTIVSRALRQAGVEAPVKGVSAHLFRHSLATRMLRSGASLTEIGEVLRH
ncbi:MAG: tyrosine-type recombinase/integrase, partial [Planctomycetota bacterium]